MSSSMVWARIWELHIPNKIKAFGWRACHNILLTREKLWQQRIIEDDSCPICCYFPETSIHALWECGAVEDVWVGCPIRILKKGLTNQFSVMRLFENLTHKLTEEDFKYFWSKRGLFGTNATWFCMEEFCRSLVG